MTGPSAEPGSIVAGMEAVEAGLIVALLSGEAVSFEAGIDTWFKDAIRAGSIRMILFVGNNIGRFIGLQRCRTQMIAVLITDDGLVQTIGGIAVIRIDGFGIYACDEAEIVGDRKGEALEIDRTVTLAFAVDLDGAEVDALDLLTANPFDDLPGA